jgi:K+-transporting ATPase KdpF subunit
MLGQQSEDKHHARRIVRGHHDIFLRRIDRLRSLLRACEVGETMATQSLVMLVISALVTVYLFYALLRPEKF